ncbi:MAG: choice-of-anchor D domain-containing protein, partial [Vicinamibacteria bacterium]
TGVEPLTTAPSSLNFGNQGLGSPTPVKNVTLKNNTASDLALQPFAISGAAATEYAVSATACGSTLAAYATCTVSVVFTPSVLGTGSASLDFSSNASNSPHSIALTGKGVAPVTASPASLSFGGVIIGSTSLTKTITLTNSTSSSVSVIGVSSAGTAAADYAFTSLCGSDLAAKSNCTLSITLTPSATGSRPATIVITTSAANSPHTVSLAGSGQ